MLLVMSPKVLEEIVNADSGAPCSPRHSRKKLFLGKKPLVNAVLRHVIVILSV